VTELARKIDGLVKAKNIAEAVSLLPNEQNYPAELEDIVPVKPS
jgi:hypothetical protein